MKLKTPRVRGVFGPNLLSPHQKIYVPKDLRGEVIKVADPWRASAEALEVDSGIYF